MNIKKRVLVISCVFLIVICLNLSVSAECINNLGEFDEEYLFFTNDGRTEINVDLGANGNTIEYVTRIYISDVVKAGDTTTADRIWVWNDSYYNDNKLFTRLLGQNDGGDWQGCRVRDNIYTRCRNLKGSNATMVDTSGNPFNLTFLHMYTDGSDGNRKFKICVDINIPDEDGDGYDITEDCNDTDENINPGETEACDGIDNDCDGITDEDCTCTDGQTSSISCGIGACATSVTITCANGQWEAAECTPLTPPESSEESCQDNIDNDCDGKTDYDDSEDCFCSDDDGDGFSPDGGPCGDIDCDDANPQAYPGAGELCDGVDNDCNGEIDKGCAVKWDQTGSIKGSCQSDQCYYYDGFSGICVKDGNYSMDYYCDHGQWTTRTLMLALELINLTENLDNAEYTLLCDSYANALNDMQYFVQTAKYDALDYVLGREEYAGIRSCKIECADPFGFCPCVNNFCVLNYRDPDDGEYKVALGVSINMPIDSAENYNLSLLRLFEESQETFSTDGHKDFCDSVIAAGQGIYLGCDREGPIQGDDANIWYNTKTASLIYSPAGIVVGEASFTTTLANFILHPINTLMNIFAAEDPSSVEYVEGIKFDKLYINKFKEKEIRGLVDIDKPEMKVTYENIFSNICEMTDNVLNKISCSTPECITCRVGFEGSRPAFYIESSDPYVVGLFGQRGLWPDLTAKIRLREEAEFGEGDFIEGISSEEITSAEQI